MESRESIVQLVKSPHALERLSAVIASAHLWLFDKTNKEDYLHYLESGLQDIDWNVRRAAVFSLETLSSTASLPLLQKRIQDEKNEYVKAALEKAIAFLQNKVSQEKK